MRHIAIIGIDGAGKTTQAKLLVSALEQKLNQKVYYIKGDGVNCKTFDWIEKSGMKVISRRIRLTGYALDFIACLLEIQANQDPDSVFVWDRYTYCLLSYFNALQVDLEEIRVLLSVFHPPEMAFLLNLDTAVAVERLLNRTRPIKKEENYEYLEKVRLQYLDLAKKEHLFIVDASKPCSEVHEIILEQSLQVLGKF